MLSVSSRSLQQKQRGQRLIEFVLRASDRIFRMVDRDNECLAILNIVDRGIVVFLSILKPQ